ncbi:hypothetical protein GCM10009864_04960 [Streptomyces lunalinharesii]|uniref:Uncharacterized protein n=1 Tax=Streptomyces lunalinharesii TaxID=333384 RepID=A0ABN3R7D4_9ACTN
MPASTRTTPRIASSPKLRPSRAVGLRREDLDLPLIAASSLRDRFSRYTPYCGRWQRQPGAPAGTHDSRPGACAPGLLSI